MQISAGFQDCSSLLGRSRASRCTQAINLRVFCSGQQNSSTGTSQPHAQPRTVDRRQLLSSATAAALAPWICACCPSPLIPNASANGGWGYGELSGPAEWGGVCSSGTRQSPINIPLPAPGPKSAASVRSGPHDFHFSYNRNAAVTVIASGHGTMQVNFPAGNFCSVDGETLELIQFHFHAPSEHAFSGRHSSMEAHLVHKNPTTGALAVLAVMLQRGAVAPNRALETALRYGPLGGAPPNPTRVDVSALLPRPSTGEHRPYVHYSGSLTTPPCSEEVSWYVFTTPVKVMDRQVLDFMEYLGGRLELAENVRPLQPLGERSLELES